MTAPCTPTLTPANAAQRTWDVVVIGAGLAGTMTARQLARRDRRVLLVDKATFPRPKVCGGCLNGTALATLARHDLGHLIEDCGAVPVDHVDVAAGSRAVTLDLPTGVAVSRTALDAALIRAALDAGVDFVDGTRAWVDDTIEGQSRTVQLTTGDTTIPCTARTVVVADGLDGRALHGHTQFEVTADPHARIGCGVTLDTPATDYRPGTIYMTVGHGGYVGVVRGEADRTLVAAALDPQTVRDHGGSGPAAVAILARACRPPIPDLASAAWRGTAPLMRNRRTLVGPRVLVVGDAAGYVEPFTGEGMAWALQSAEQAAPLIHEALAATDPDTILTRWPDLRRRALHQRQLSCRVIAWSLRRPRLTRWALAALGRVPRLARPYVTRLNTPTAL